MSTHVAKALRQFHEIVAVMATSTSPGWAAAIYLAGLSYPLLAKLRALCGPAHQ